MKPKFEHDCESCKFLGHFYGHDVYTCENSVIARYSNEPSEYSSMPVSSLIDSLGTEQWAGDRADRAMVAAITCQHLNGVPRNMPRFSSIGAVRGAVDQLKWDMLFGRSSQDIVPDPDWGLEASVAFNHFYIARSLLEQAAHHLSIAGAHDRVCWTKFREQQEAREAANAAAR